MFLHVCVILFPGGVQGEPPPLGQGEPPPGQGDPPPGRETNPDQGDHPPGPGGPPWTRQIPPDQGDPPPDQGDPPGSRLQNTVYERPVRILLECILVLLCDFIYLSKALTATQQKLQNFFSRESVSSCNGNTGMVLTE